MKKLIITLDDDLHKKAKVIALLKNITLNKFILDSIKKGVQQDKNLFQQLKDGK